MSLRLLRLPELRQWTDLIVEELSFDPRARRAVAAEYNQAVESGVSDPADEESSGGDCLRAPTDDEVAASTIPYIRRWRRQIP
jgi:hypothetical protein